MTPVYAFDEHNEAFFYWQKARHDGFIDLPLDLLHVDAHDDMGRRESFARSLYFPNGTDSDYLAYYREFARTELDIASFILPAVLNKLVRNVYFVYPHWRNFKPRRCRTNVSSVFGEGKILRYGFKVGGDSESRLLKVFSDLTHFNYSMLPVDRIPRNRRVILDIDLDFFACRDSIGNHMGYELEVTREQFAARDVLLRDETLRFSGVAFQFTERDGRYSVTVSPRREKDISHLPSRQEIVAGIGALVNTLVARKVKPAAVTICRSCVSGYCPSEYAGFIEEELKRALPQLTGQCSERRARDGEQAEGGNGAQG